MEEVIAALFGYFYLDVDGSILRWDKVSSSNESMGINLRNFDRFGSAISAQVDLECRRYCRNLCWRTRR